jgi:hypothetical protein
MFGGNVVATTLGSAGGGSGRPTTGYSPPSFQRRGRDNHRGLSSQDAKVRMIGPLKRELIAAPECSASSMGRFLLSREVSLQPPVVKP